MFSRVNEILRDEIEKNLPKNVYIEGLPENPCFFFVTNDIIKEATEEGYHIILFMNNRVDNIRPDGTYVKFHSLHNEENDLKMHSKHNWPDKVCCVWPDIPKFEFYHRGYYKGQASREWNLHRDNGPAEYSFDEICWLKDGKYHRDNNLPAALSEDCIDWCVNGKWHRSDGGYTKVNVIRQEISYHVNHKEVKIERYSDGKLIQEANVNT